MVEISTVVNPVTHTAEVLVNNELIKLSHVPDWLEIGSDSNNEPIKIIIKNPESILILGGIIILFANFSIELV